MRQPSSSLFPAKKMSLDGVVYLVRLLEASFRNLSLRKDNSLRWPKTIGDLEMPEVDGVLMLYDVMNYDSIEGIADVLGMSFSLIACLKGLCCICTSHHSLARSCTKSAAGRSGICQYPILARIVLLPSQIVANHFITLMQVAWLARDCHVFSLRASATIRQAPARSTRSRLAKSEKASTIASICARPRPTYLKARSDASP